MSDAWYYAEADKPIGPITLEDLKRFLSSEKNWREYLVWNRSFNEWRRASDLPELDVVEPPPLPQKSIKTKSPWLHRIAYVTAFLVVGSITKVLVHDYLHNESSLNSDAKVEEGLDLAERQAKVPQRVDDVTTLVSVKHTKYKQLTYTYRLSINDPQVLNSFIVPLRKEVASNVCKQMDYVLRLGVTVEYQYQDSSDRPVGRFSLDKNDCKI